MPERPPTQIYRRSRVIENSKLRTSHICIEICLPNLADSLYSCSQCGFAHVAFHKPRAHYFCYKCRYVYECTHCYKPLQKRCGTHATLVCGYAIQAAIKQGPAFHLRVVDALGLVVVFKRFCFNFCIILHNVPHL